MKSNSLKNLTAGELAEFAGTETQRLRRIRLAMPRQFAVISAMEELRCSAFGRMPREGCRGLRIIEPTGAGKSETAIRMTSFVSEQPGRDPTLKPVHHVTLDALGTPKSAIASCLKQFQAGYSTQGSESDLLDRLKTALDEFQVELMIIDELNHCANKTLGRDVSNIFKNILTAGWVPICFLGTDDAKTLFAGNKELRTRCRLHPGLRPFDPQADIEEWAAFATGMDEEMFKQAIITRTIGLDDAKLAKDLCIACAGSIGELVNILEDALLLALRERGRVVEIPHLVRATEMRCVLDGDFEVNPLADWA
jgi:hypothetical protein